jgi:hypothetical protein
MKAWEWCSQYFRVGRGVQIDVQRYVYSLHTVHTDKIFTWYRPVRLQQVFRESSKIFISGSTTCLEISSVHAQRSKGSALLPAQRGTWYRPTCSQDRKLRLMLWTQTAGESSVILFWATIWRHQSHYRQWTKICLQQSHLPKNNHISIMFTTLHHALTVSCSHRVSWADREQRRGL